MMCFNTITFYLSKNCRQSWKNQGIGKGFVSDGCLTSTENKYNSSCKPKGAELSEYLELSLSSPHVFKLYIVIIYIQFEPHVHAHHREVWSHIHIINKIIFIRIRILVKILIWISVLGPLWNTVLDSGFDLLLIYSQYINLWIISWASLYNQEILERSQNILLPQLPLTCKYFD